MYCVRTSLSSSPFQRPLRLMMFAQSSSLSLPLASPEFTLCLPSPEYTSELLICSVEDGPIGGATADQGWRPGELLVS